MQLIRHLPLQHDKPTAVAIGNFDGLHRGHQAVIEAMVKAAHKKGLVPSVLTFEPHPRRFFGPGEPAFRLERLGTKLQRLEAASVARIYMPRFDAGFANMPAQEFLDRVLGQQLGAKVVVTGENFAFGKKRGGDVAMLRSWGEKNGSEIITVVPVRDHGHACSSSAVRLALGHGDMPHVAALLGRAYALRGIIVHGDGRGAQFGFATANIALPPLLKLPAYGVYAVRAEILGVQYDGVANLGVKPTVSEGKTPVLEVHLFDYDAQSYGERIDVKFISKIRDEKKFDSIDALVAQIAHDCVSAKTLLAKGPR